MAAFTTTQAGNWSDTATWGGSGPPTDGDTVTISKAVTVTASASVGNSPNNTTSYVITFTSAGSLVINTGVTLTCKGNVNNNGGSLTINGNGKLLFDGSAIGTGRSYKLFHNGVGKTYLLGTDDSNRATIDSHTGGGFWWLRSGGTSMSLATASYGLISRCGDASNAAWEGDESAYSGQTISITNTKFVDCGYVKFAAAHATATVLIQDVEFVNSLQSPSVLLRGFAGASFTVNRCIFSGQFYLYVSDSILMTNVYAGKQFQNITGAGLASGSGNNLYVHPSGAGVTWNGSLSDLYYFHNNSDNQNYYAIKFQGTASGEEISSIILDYGDTSLGQPDGMGVISLTTGRSYAVKNNLMLPDSAGTSSGCWFTANAIGGGTMAVEHNTYVTVASTQTGTYCGEGGRGETGMWTSFKSNLAWTPSGKTAGWKIVRHSASTIQDYVTSANADYNWGYGIGAGSEGNGYECSDTSTSFFTSGTPDTNGGTADPQFLDTTRNLVTFDIAGLSNSAATAWADTTVYSVGDVVSASDAGYFDGETINWRCITAHTAATADSTNGKPGAVSGFRSNWEPMSLYRLREDTTRIADLMTWVRAGFAPTNESYRDAGHDGVTVGAVEMAAGGPTPLNATLTATLAGVTAASEVISLISAGVTATLGGASASSTAQSTISASVTSTLDGVTATSSAVSPIDASVTSTLDGVTVAASASGPTGVSASLTAQLAGITATAAASVAITGSLTNQLAGVTAVSSVTSLISAGVTSTLDGVSVSSRIGGTVRNRRKRLFANDLFPH